MYDNVKFYGRGTGPDENGRIPLFWSGSGFEFETDASEAYMTVVSDYGVNEQWFAIWLDGVMVSRRMADRGHERVCLFRGKNENGNTRVRVTKETQPMGDDPESYIYIENIECEGTIKKVPDRKYSFEVIGDSITSGEGTYGRKKSMEWISAYFSYERTYECQIGELMDADISVISMSGWGVNSAWDNNRQNRIPRIYEQICQPACGEVNRSFGSDKKYDFSKKMDAVIINLGTNDMGSFDNPEWISPDGKDRFKNHKNPDGTLDEKDAMRFAAGAENFLEEVHEKNPHARIVWVYGQLGYVLTPYINIAIENFKNNTGFGRVTMLTLPRVTEQTEGSREHPGFLSHRECAGMISNALANDGLLI